VRIHRQKPKALGLKFGCGFTRHLFHQGSPASGSAAIFETDSKATTTPVAPAVPRVFAFSMQAEQSIVVDPKSPGGINSSHGLILFDGDASYARAAAASSANVIAAVIFASFRSSWPRDVPSLSISASILIARIPLPSWRAARPM
jgi:hypothetical protein